VVELLDSVMISSANEVTRIQFAPDLQAVNFAKQIRGKNSEGASLERLK